MKRLTRISFNNVIFSFIPVLQWFLLGILVDKNLANVFTLTYPIQFIYSVFYSVFGVGPNICQEKEKDENAVLSGMTWGIIISFFVFLFLAIHIDSYIQFMNLDVSIYREFGLYSIIQLYISVVFSYVLEKLYYDGKEKLANRYCITFNALNFIILISSSILFKDKWLMIVITLISIFVYTFYVTVKQYHKFKMKFQFFKYIRYDSMDIFENIMLFLIYLFGLSRSIEYGSAYVLALNFATLLTDSEWDAFGAITTVAKIDICKNHFNYKEHLKNAYKLLGILFGIIFLSFVLLNPFYKVSLSIFFVYLGLDIVCFLLSPLYKIKNCYLQIEYSPVKATTNKIISNVLRVLCSFLNTPFCTALGQVVSSIYQYITVHFMFQRNYKMQKNGYIKIR